MSNARTPEVIVWLEPSTPGQMRFATGVSFGGAPILMPSGTVVTAAAGDVEGLKVTVTFFAGSVRFIEQSEGDVPPERPRPAEVPEGYREAFSTGGARRLIKS